MLVNEIICNLLKDVTCNVFYIHKPDKIPLDTYITFDATIKNDWYSDGTYELEEYFVIINILSKDQNQIPKMIKQIKSIIDESENCCYFYNRGNTFIKNTMEFFNASTFYLYVPKQEVEDKEEITE